MSGNKILIIFSILALTACDAKDLIKWNQKGDDLTGEEVFSYQNLQQKPVRVNNNIQARSLALSQPLRSKHIPAAYETNTFPNHFYNKEFTGKFVPVMPSSKPPSLSGYNNSNTYNDSSISGSGSNGVMIDQKPPRNEYSNNVNYYSKPSTYWSFGAQRVQRLAEKLSTIKDPKKKNFIYKIGKEVASANEEIQKEKIFLNRLISKYRYGSKLSSDQKTWLNQLAEKYDVENFAIHNSNKVNTLKRRVDIVPESLAIAQAALESGWGTSRFSREGLNYFGQWCFSKGCGMVPLRRDSNKSHEVKTFASLKDSVDAYIHNLNTHRAYKAFRIARNNLGSSRITGSHLANYLNKYSTQGSKYTKMLESIILANNLE
jgi:Bax protein